MLSELKQGLGFRSYGYERGWKEDLERIASSESGISVDFQGSKA